MANISSYLAAIMAAVYGEDVRSSIHDAIEIINDVSEVVLTTGTAVTGPTSSSSGFYDSSLYLNTNTMELWKCVGTNSWASQGVLKGSDGRGITSIAKTSTSGLVDTYTITYDSGSPSTFTVTNGADGADGANGSVWYKGTAITGTGSGMTGFPGNEHDFYLNSTDGYVYTCTATGTAVTATWDYVMTLTGGGGSSVTVVDNLNSTSGTDALSANQGHVLNTNKQDKLTEGNGINIDPVTLELSVDLLAGSNITITPQASGALRIDSTGGGGSSTLSGLSDVNLTAPSNNEILKYDSSSSKWVNGTGGGHNMIPNNTAITSLMAKATDSTDDDVASGYAIANWSNAEIITLVAHMDKDDDTVGTWEESPLDWKTTGVRTGWIWHSCLYNIVADNEVEISIDFDVAGKEVVGLYAYRVDDNVQNGGVDGGAIAIKLTSPIKNPSGVDVAVNLKRQRTQKFNATILS